MADKQKSGDPAKVVTVAEKREWAIDFARHQLQYQIDSAVENLAWRLESLAGECTKAVESLKQTPVYVYNSLGVVQGRGSEIDGLCRMLYQLQQDQRLVEQLIEYGQLEPEQAGPGAPGSEESGRSV